MEDKQVSNSPSSGGAFDPFRDRRSRDIRNALSEAFVEAWIGGAAYEPLAEALRRRHALPVYRRYIDRRLENYRAALEERRKLTDADLIDEMIVLWNRKLFFEVHELLENHWHKAEGVWRGVLQALILAAAVYVHREAGRTVAAQKLARRARERLDALRSHLASIENLNALGEALKSPEDAPPWLEKRVR